MLRHLLPVGLAGLFILQDPSEVERLVSSLGSESVEVREKAEKRLIELGPKAVPALRKAALGADPETRARAQSAIDDIERLEREGQHDQKEKERLLRDFRDEKKAKREEESGAVLLEAARFELSVKPFKKGLVLYTFPWNYLYLEGRWEEISFDVADVKDQNGKTLDLERCGKCSPNLILVKETAGPLRAHVQGTQLWFSTYTVEFKEPRNGDQQKVGDFTIRVAWPRLKVSSAKSWRKDIMEKVGTSFDFDVKEGVRPPIGFLTGGGGGGGGHFGRTSPDWWCNCKGGPVPVVPKSKPELVQSLDAGGGGDGYRLDQIKAITYTFYKPIEDPIDFTADVPKP